MEALNSQTMPLEGRTDLVSGKYLKQAREFLGYKSKAVADRLKIQHSTLQNIENGTAEPRDGILEKFAECYDWPINWLSMNKNTAISEKFESHTPIPTGLDPKDQNEIRDFKRVMRSRDVRSFKTDTVKRLSLLAIDDKSSEALHRELNTYDQAVDNCMIEIFKALFGIGVVVFLRPISKESEILLRSDRKTSVMLSVSQTLTELRFSAAGALSALLMRNHSEHSQVFLTIKDEDSFKLLNEECYQIVLNLLLPNFLLDEFMAKQKWASAELANPVNMYQASLRLGTSYRSTIQAFNRHGYLSSSDFSDLVETDVTDIKRSLLEDFPVNSIKKREVWHLTKHDENTIIRANPKDLFVLNLKEHSSAGYEWNIESLKEVGFKILHDETKPEGLGQIGAPSHRFIVFYAEESNSGDYVIEESCPWRREPTPDVNLRIRYRRFPQLITGRFILDSEHYLNLVD